MLKHNSTRRVQASYKKTVRDEPQRKDATHHWPLKPVADDIYNIDKEDLNPNDLDIPGAEQDDAEEEIGSEDEENNYYSLGGDDHNNLEEDN